MAERSNAASKKHQEPAQDVSTLQKRGRRRLVGAIALVLLAVIILPMVFDPEPRPNTPAVSIRIPNEEGTKFTPKVAPKPPAPADLPKAEVKPEPAPAVEPAKPAVEPVKEEPKPTPPPQVAEKPAPPSKATSSREQFVVQVGAFASPEKVKEITDQLKGAKLTHFTEKVATSKGSVTRVRLGPYNSMETAEKARERAKALGLNPANPVAANPAAANPAAK